jgi:hypothetical protein
MKLPAYDCMKIIEEFDFERKGGLDVEDFCSVMREGAS